MRRVLLIVALAGVALVVTLIATSRGRSPKTPAAQGAASSPPASSEPPASIPISSGWSLRRGNSGAGWRPVSIPNDFNPLITPADDRQEVAWYRVSFKGPPAAAGRSWAVHFEAVRRRAEVWLNGRQIGSSWDPYAPFTVPATSLKPGASNVLLVRVENFRTSDPLPEDWWNWGGIMGPVTLEPVGRAALEDLGVMPELSCRNRCADLLVVGTLKSTWSTPLRPSITVQATSPSGIVTAWQQPLPTLAPGQASAVSFRVPVRGPLELWSPQTPALYHVRVAVTTPGRTEQVQILQSGIRSVQVRDGILYLNGRRVWLHGASIHEDTSGHGAAVTEGDIETIVSDLRSLGANVTRAHYLLSPRLLDALDAAGIMVWSQPPVDHADPALVTPAGRAKALGLLRDTILGERSHPSVIVDSVGNELSPAPDVTPGTRGYIDQAIPAARALDPIAPVGLDVLALPNYPAQQTYSKVDVLGISAYFGWDLGQAGHSEASFAGLRPFLTTFHARHPRKALVVSEFGAEGLYDGPVTVKGSYSFQSDYLRRTLDVLDGLPFMNGAIYWTLREFAEGPGWTGGATVPPGFAPDMVHHKGLIAYDGTPKPAFAVAAQLLSDPPPYAR